MVWCSSCGKNVHGYRPDDSQLCCDFCGKVLESQHYSTEVTFVKNAAGQSQMSGNYINSIRGQIGASRERLLDRAFEEMRQMKDVLGIEESDELVHIAKRLYGLAVDKNFTKGRRTEQVQASCLYFACRLKKKPFLLIDFSNYLSINVYELGSVYLQLCQVLYVDKESMVQVDPSIFLNKFSDRLQIEGGNKIMIRDTARDILVSMKRDWMTTGRKPSGLCGAALYISALTHGQNLTKSDVVKIVHVCEATLTKRLMEFENTDSGSLTIEDFMAKKKELQESSSNKHLNTVSKASSSNEFHCKHKEEGKPFAYGLCRSCYDDFMTISQGLEGGSDPPAFQVAERERIAKASAEENEIVEREMNSPFVSGDENILLTEPESIGAGTKQVAYDEADCDRSPAAEALDEPEKFPDIDDLEVAGYLHSEEEQKYKKIIWEEMNREYLEEQAAKEAAAAAEKAAFEANYKGDPEGLQAAWELAAKAAANAAKSRKERQQKRAAEAKSSGPAQTAADATRQVLNKKRLSSKINYAVLDTLFKQPVASENPKKQRTESHSDNDEKDYKDGELELEGDYDAKENEVEAYGNEEDYGNVEDYGDYEDDEYAYDGF